MVALVFISHLVADFIFQSRQMGENKSKSIKWLLTHVIVYASVLGLLTFALFPTIVSFTSWIALNFFLHLATDFVSSKLSGYFYLKKNMYRFWNVIGADQTIHFITLYYTFKYFTGYCI